MTVYNETCMNRSCSKAETLLRKKGTFYLVCMLHISLKRKPQRGHCFRRTTFFSSQIQKVTCLRRTQIKFLGILDIFVNFLKKKRFFFLHFKIVNISCCSFWRKAIILSIIAQFLLILTAWWMHHRFAKVHLANRKQVTGKKLVEWQTWILKRSDFSYAVYLWKIRSRKFIFL